LFPSGFNRYEKPETLQNLVLKTDIKEFKELLEKTWQIEDCPQAASNSRNLASSLPSQNVKRALL